MLEVAASRYNVELADFDDIEGDGNDKPLEVKSSESSKVITKVIEENGIAYMKIPTFDPAQIGPDREVVENFLREVNDYPYVILDIRGNTGGSEYYWIDLVVPYLISEPVSYTTYFDYYSNVTRVIEPANNSEFNGDIYLLVDHSVYSSSESFAVFAKETGFATLVGGVTSGDGISKITPLVVTLPNSGLVVSFPITMGLTSEGYCNEEYKTVPDVITEASDAESVVLEMIKEGE